MKRTIVFARAGMVLSVSAMLASVAFVYGQAAPPPPPQQQQQQSKDQGKDAQKDKAPGQNAPGQAQAKDQEKEKQNAPGQANDKGREGDMKGQQQGAQQQNQSQGAQQQNQQQNQPRPGQTQPGQTRDQGRDLRQGQDQGRDQRTQSQYDQSRDQRTQGQSNQSRDQRMQGQYDQGRDQRTQGQYDQRSRDTARQTRDEGAASGRSTFRSSDVRAPDIGLWFDRNDRNGLVISDISSKGAISRLGFHEGDRIVSVNGYRVNRETDFLNYLFANDVRDQRVKVIVDRNGGEEVVWVEPTTLIEDYNYVENDPLENFGVVLDDRYDDRIVVWKVIPQSPAYYAGLRAGDVFTTFHGRPVTTRQDFVRIIGDLREGEVPVQVRRGERVRDFAVDVPRFEARSERRTAMRPNYDTTRAAQRQDNRQERREDRREDRGQGGQVPAPGLQPRR
jgi:C-terminal processing protease CtpA/Prc